MQSDDAEHSLFCSLQQTTTQATQVADATQGRATRETPSHRARTTREQQGLQRASQTADDCQHTQRWHCAITNTYERESAVRHRVAIHIARGAVTTCAVGSRVTDAALQMHVTVQRPMPARTKAASWTSMERPRAVQKGNPHKSMRHVASARAHTPSQRVAALSCKQALRRTHRGKSANRHLIPAIRAVAARTLRVASAHLTLQSRRSEKGPKHARIFPHAQYCGTRVTRHNARVNSTARTLANLHVFEDSPESWAHSCVVQSSSTAHCSPCTRSDISSVGFM